MGHVKNTLVKNKINLLRSAGIRLALLARAFEKDVAAGGITESVAKVWRQQRRCMKIELRTQSLPSHQFHRQLEVK